MRRVLVAVAILAIASGCLRKRIDVCGDNPDDPECVDGSVLRDAAVDGAADGAIAADAAPDAAALDAGELDAGVDAAVDGGSDAASDGS